MPREARDRALREFTPPPHRLQLVAMRDGVSFVDDSKATNPEAAMKALTAFDDGVRLILGGSLKGASFAELAAAVAAGPVGVGRPQRRGGRHDRRGARRRAASPIADTGDLADAVRAGRRRCPTRRHGAAVAGLRAASTSSATTPQRGDVFAALAAEVPVGR